MDPTRWVLTGLIVEIDGKGSNVQAFTLESGGERYEVAIAPDVEYGFELAHLHTTWGSGCRSVVLEILDALT